MLVKKITPTMVVHLSCTSDIMGNSTVLKAARSKILSDADLQRKLIYTGDKFPPNLASKLTAFLQYMYSTCDCNIKIPKDVTHNTMIIIFAKTFNARHSNDSVTHSEFFLTCLGHPFEIFHEPFKRLGHPFGISHKPFKWLAHPF